MASFTHVHGTMSPQYGRPAKITVRVYVNNCTGMVYITDMNLQEGDMLSGYTPHTEISLKKSENTPVWFNGIVRSEETVILLNLGGTSAGLDIHLYPKQRMETAFCDRRVKTL